VEDIPGKARMEIQANGLLILLDAFEKKGIPGSSTQKLSLILKKNGIDTTRIDKATGRIRKNKLALKELGKQEVSLSPKGRTTVQELNKLLKRHVKNISSNTTN